MYMHNYTIFCQNRIVQIENNLNNVGKKDIGSVCDIPSCLTFEDSGYFPSQMLLQNQKSEVCNSI